jgi:predicted phage tail protein
MIGNGRAARTFRIHIALQVVGAPAGIAMNHVFGAAMPYVRFWLAVAGAGVLCSAAGDLAAAAPRRVTSLVGQHSRALIRVEIASR